MQTGTNVATTTTTTSKQWRSKTLRGPGSTVTWGPSISLPSTFPPLSLMLPAQPLPLPRGGPPNPARRSGERCKLPQRGLVHFSLKIRHLAPTILMIFLRALPKIFLWPHYSWAPGAWGPGSLNRLNLRFLRHCFQASAVTSDKCVGVRDNIGYGTTASAATTTTVSVSVLS